MNESNNNIYIIQQERPNSNQLLFMYKPFVNTVSKLFSQSKFLYNNWENINFNPNDIIIIIGSFFQPCHIEDLINFKNKNLYIIIYWTEPTLVDKNIGQYCDEIYLYSKGLFQLQQKHFDQQIIKFVPILKEDTTFFVNYLNKKKNIKLCFLGYMSVRSKKVNHILLGGKYFRKKIFIRKYDLFDENQYNMYIVNNTNIFLNVNKKNTNILPFCRICKLLSHKCLIISQHCNKEDEELFEDMVYFCSIDDIKKTFYNLSLKSPSELNDISNKNYIKFCDKFSVKNDNLFLTK